MKTNWHHTAPYILTVTSLISLILCAILYWNEITSLNELYTKETLIHLPYAMQVKYITIQASLIRRASGLLVGLCICFIGLSISLYQEKERSALSAGIGSLRAQLISASPGIICLAIGGLLIFGSIHSKDSIYPYNGPENQKADDLTPLIEQLDKKKSVTKVTNKTF